MGIRSCASEGAVATGDYEIHRYICSCILLELVEICYWAVSNVSRWLIRLHPAKWKHVKKSGRVMAQRGRCSFSLVSFSVVSHFKRGGSHIEL